jgi:hypothetical protein
MENMQNVLSLQLFHDDTNLPCVSQVSCDSTVSCPSGTSGGGGGGTRPPETQTGTEAAF